MTPEENKVEPHSATGTGQPVSPIDQTDGRKPFEWESRWPAEARRAILFETIWLFVVYFVTLFLLYATWLGWIGTWLSLLPDQGLILRRYSFYAFAGMLGGVTFGMKYFYRVVARGRWNKDRLQWRLMSPFIAMTIALVIGMLIDTNGISVQTPKTTPIPLGFLAGYFADEAVSKMYEVASVIFGKSASTKSDHAA
jgi:hypothetical protein